MIEIEIDIFRKNGIELIKGDCLETLPKLKKNFFDTCITDPPYNISGYDGKKEIGWLKSNLYWKNQKRFDIINENWDKFSDEEYAKFTKEWLGLVFNVVKENGNILIFGTYHNIFLIGHLLQEMNRKIVNSIVWYKRNAFPNITQRMLCESTEYIIWAVNNDKKHAKKWNFDYEIFKKLNKGKQMRNVWDIPHIFSKSERKFGKHPAQKPIPIIERLVLGFTKKGDTVIDPFMGSGTIPLVCATNNRKGIGIEIDERYFDIAKRRISSILTNNINEYVKNKER